MRRIVYKGVLLTQAKGLLRSAKFTFNVKTS